jgi:putative PIN family toxin of toxin-antitoxin system
LSLRVLPDTNRLISFLLAPQATERTIVQVIQHAIAGTFTLLVPADLLAELERTLSIEPYLRQRITPDQAHTFAHALRDLAELLPSLSKPLPRVVCDRHDDYLLAATLFADADMLVSGDADLLTLREHLVRPRILTAAELLAMLAP